MADKKQPQYPVRVQLPPTTLPAPSTARAVGSAVRRAAGIAPSAAIDSLPVIGPAAHIVGPALAAVPAAFHEFLGGLTGTPAAPATATPAAAPAAAAGYGPVEPVAAAMQQGARAEATPITPQQRLLAAMSSILSKPFTLHDFNSVANASGDLLKPDKPVSQKDLGYGTTLTASQALFQDQINQAQELAKTDQKGAQTAAAKATNDFVSRNAAILGSNPLNLAMAQSLPAPDDTGG